MRITVIAFGTRGDVQPLVALAKALQSLGHQVCILAGSNFRGWIKQHGLQAADSAVDIQSVMEEEQAAQWVKHGNNPLVNMRVMRELYLRHGRQMMVEAWEACQGSQVIISSLLSDVYAVSIAEGVGARHMSAWLQPSMVATRSGAATFNAPLPGHNSWLNYLFTKSLVEPFLWNLSGDIANNFRRDIMGRPAQSLQQNSAARRRMLVLHGYSPQVIPHPPDWPANFHTTGYWFLDEGPSWKPPAELTEFIEAGDPPVCLGFGSMSGGDPAALTKLLIDGVQRSGERAVLLSGWAGVGAGSLPPTIFRVEAAPHAWLFPRARAVVHHGGAGATAASLCAGVPTIVVPHLADQAFWGNRVERLGVGPPLIRREDLTASNLASAIKAAASDSGMKQRAADLGGRIRAEDGVQRAVQLTDAWLRSAC